MKSGIPCFGPAVLLGCFISVAEAQTPELLAQPTNQVAVAGGAATNAQLRFPWGVAVDGSGSLFIADQNNNVIREVFIPGPKLVLNNVVAANAGAYDVVVSNPYGSVTSSVVTLALALPPLNALLVGRQAVQLQFQGTPGASYLLLSATDLTPPVDWRPVITNIAGPSGAWTFTDTNVPSTRTGFYRMSTSGQ